MSGARWFAAVVWAAALLVVRPSRADVQRLAGDGTLYSVDLTPWIQSGKVNGTVIRATRQKPDGVRDSLIIPGTDDAAVERDPALEIDPSSGLPTLVWARNDGLGFDLYVSRFEGSWSSPQLLARMDGDDVNPQIRFDRRYLHVSWRQEYLGKSTYWRSSFLAATLAPAFGPERVLTDGPAPLSLDGDSAVSAAPPAGDQYFSVAVFSQAPGSPGHACIWGVRDEPVPVNYRQTLALPAVVQAVSSSEARFLAGRFTFWITTPDDRLYYTTLVDGRWEAMRVIELSPKTSSADAKLLLIELNQRLVVGGH